MTTPEEYQAEVQAVVAEAAERFDAPLLRDVRSLVDHGEPAEGMLALAWLIVVQGARVLRQMIDDVRRLSQELVPDDMYPEDLDAHALEDDVP